MKAKAAYTITNVLADWVWVVGQKRFVRRRDGKMWDVQQFDSKYNYMVKSASISKALFKDRDMLSRFDSVVFRPGQPDTLPNDLYNTWRPSEVEPAQGDTTIWSEHLRYLFPAATDRDLLLNWLAWAYQNPTLKPNHALLLVGETMGTGKSPGRPDILQADRRGQYQAPGKTPRSRATSTDGRCNVSSRLSRS